MKTLTVPSWPGSFVGAKSFTITLSGLNGAGVTIIRSTGTGTILSG